MARQSRSNTQPRRPQAGSGGNGQSPRASHHAADGITAGTGRASAAAPGDSLDPLDYPICMSVPRRVAPSGWTQHVPFGMFLIDLLRPALVVELGTHYGVSYCAFCQAVQELGIDTRCYAVDTWQGDEQAGVYGPAVLEDLRQHHDSAYGCFSRLIQSTFDEALSQFDDGTVDLLHVDGFHSYQAARHDFEAWLPKVSDRGVV